MIFITLGSQKFQFNRLLKEVDRLISEGIIQEEVVAQIGYSNYKPKNYTYYNFLDKSKLTEIIDKSDRVITHGGTGAIINGVKLNKKVIAVPRLSEFDEHVDDHQLQIVSEFKKMGLIEGVMDISELGEKLKSIDDIEFRRYISNTHNIIVSIEDFINT